MPELPKSRKFNGKISPDITEQSRSPDFYVSLVFSKNVFCAGFQTSLCKRKRLTIKPEKSFRAIQFYRNQVDPM
uniref:Uncharacterized protein n=1 Tax=uncultured marine Nitrospinaceae bacterium TaxID=482920 RepID=A4GJ58_9BACT|nr:hypothetical protein [uncultured marine Nitrospinaceae bacterium]